MAALAGMAFCCWQVACTRSAQSYLDKGNQFYAQGKYQDAILNYRNSLKRNPALAEAHARLAQAQLQQGQWPEAFSELRRAIALAPAREDLKIRLADWSLLAYSRDPQKPRALYDVVAKTSESLLKKNPNSFDGLRLQGDVFILDRRLDEALAAFQKANGIKHLEPSVVLSMMQVLFALNRPAEAESLAHSALREHKDAAAIYDALLDYYQKMKRPADAEVLLRSKIANMPKDPTPILQLAEAYRQSGSESQMSQTLHSIIDRPKLFPGGFARVGEFYAKINRLDDAIQQYQLGLRSSDNATDRANYEKRIASVLVAQGKPDEAIEQLSRALKDNPGDDDIRIARAILLRTSNDPKKLDSSISEFQALIQANPSDEVLRLNLGLAYLAKGDTKSARGELTESARLRSTYIPPRMALAGLAQRERKYDETIRLANEILAMEPTNEQARFFHIGGLLGNKAYVQARSELSAMLAQHPESISANLEMALLDAGEKKFAQAEARYRRLYKPGDKDLRPLEGLVQLYIDQEQTDRALALLAEEIRHTPDSMPVHALFASTAARGGKLDLATEQYQWLQAHDSGSPEVYASLGDLYQLKGDVNSALASYQKARDLVPNDPKIIAMIAFLQNASGKEFEAIATLQKQLAMDPQNTIAINNLAFILADTATDLDRALTLAQTAQRKDPNNPGIADTVGWVYVKKGLNDSAIQILDDLVKKYPDEPAFRYHLGVALLQKGEAAEAKAEFVISLSKNPPKDIADKIKQILSKLG